MQLCLYCGSRVDQIANVCKRVIVIAASMFVFRNPVTPANAGGMLLAILGIAMYNRAKLRSAHGESTHHHSPGKDRSALMSWDVIVWCDVCSRASVLPIHSYKDGAKVAIVKHV